MLSLMDRIAATKTCLPKRRCRLRDYEYPEHATSAISED
jgi:hypothetical protein